MVTARLATAGFRLADQPPDVQDPENIALVKWIQTLFNTQAKRLNEPSELRLSVLFAPPEKPREGQIVYADGTTWNPGSGEGPYVFDGSIWVPLAGGGGGGGLTTEDVQDIAGGMVSGNTESGITVTYDDTAGKFNFTVSAPALDTEGIQDIIGDMVTGNTESGIVVTYNDATGKLDFAVSGGTVSLVSTTDSPPASPVSGDLWWESDTGMLFVWYDDGTSSQWVEVTVGAGPVGPVGPPGTTTWAGITDKPATFPPSTHTHTIADTTGLQTALDAKAPLASPAFTGNPTAPTPTVGDEDTSVATTAFVQTAVDSATGAGLFGYFDYTFNSSAYTPPPIAGNFRMNNATQSAATHIYVHEQTATSNDASLMLDQIAVGDKLLIQRKSDATQWQRYTVTAKSDAGAYRDFTVTWVDGGSALTNARSGIIVQKPTPAGAEPPIAAGTTAQYWRGDKSWQTHDKASVGLGNVDNTSDASKPISTATQTALNLKADIASPTFTGDPKAPTPTAGDNDTSIATTAFVTAAIASAVASTVAAVGDSPPGSPTAGQLWWESDSGKLFIWYNDGSSSQWVAIIGG